MKNNVVNISTLSTLEALAGSDALFTQVGGVNGTGADLDLANILPGDALSILNAENSAVPAEQLPQVAPVELANILDGRGAGSILTEVGQSIAALGIDKGSNIGQDVVHIPGEVSGLNDTSGNVADALAHAGGTVRGVSTFVDAETSNLTSALDQPLGTTANNAVLDIHTLIEGTGDALGLGGTVHGITNLGETIGLGKIGQGNLVTDLVNLPGDALSGNVTDALDSISGHLSDISSAATGPLTGLINDLGSGPFSLGVLGPDGIVGGSGLDLGHLGDVLNPNGGGLQGVVGSLTDNVTNLLDPVGEGSMISSNLVTDALSLPGELLSGSGTPSLTDAGHQVNTTLIATGDLVENVLHDLNGGGSQSPNGLLNSVVADVNGLGGVAGPAIGIPLTLDGVHAATDALGLGSQTPANATGLVASIEQTVSGAVSDLGNDAARAGFGSLLSGDTLHLPSVSGLGADGLVGMASMGAGATNVSSATAPVLDGIDHHAVGSIVTLLDLHHDPAQQHGSLLGHGLGLA